MALPVIFITFFTHSFFIALLGERVYSFSHLRISF
jgi:hypothetical protein